jgi:hypothetical protein
VERGTTRRSSVRTPCSSSSGPGVRRPPERGGDRAEYFEQIEKAEKQ